MSTSHTQQQSLPQLASTRMKEKTLVENVVLLYTETTKLADLFIFDEIDTATWTGIEMLCFVFVSN